MTELYRSTDKKSWIYSPSFVRQRHPFRGPRTSEKVNAEIMGFRYDINRLYEKYSKLNDLMVFYLQEEIDGGAVNAKHITTPIVYEGIYDIAARIESLRNRLTRARSTPAPTPIAGDFAQARGTANDAGGRTSSAIQRATSTGAANNALANTGQFAVTATATGAANGMTTNVKPSMGNAAATGVANAAVVTVNSSAAVNAGNAAGTGASNNGSISLKANAGNAAATGAANNPAIGQPLVNAGNAAGTGAAYNAVGVPASGAIQVSSGTGAANNAVAAKGVAAAAGNAAGTGASFVELVNVQPDTTTNNGTGASNSMTTNLKPSENVATGTGAANNASISSKANAGNAAGTGAANNGSISLKPNAETINVFGFGNMDAFAMYNSFGWYDAYDASTITSSSGLVSQWNDKSGAGHHVSQSTGANKPSTGVSNLNGKNVLTFAAGGSTGFLRSAAITQAQPYTVYSVAKAGENLHDHIIWCGGSLNTMFLMTGPAPQAHATAVWDMFVSATNNNSAAGIPDSTSAHIYTCVINGVNLKVVRSGTTIITGNAGSGGFAAETIEIGGEPNATWYGDIAEVIFFKGAHTTAQQTMVTNYLGLKWGVA